MALTKCTECGKEISSTVKSCPHCGFAVPKKRSSWSRLGIFILLVIGVAIYSQGKNGSSTTSSVQAITDTNLKTLAANFDFSEAARSPQQCNGKLVKGDGKVIQVAEGWGNSVTLRVDVTRKIKSYGVSWDDTVLMHYDRRSDNESRILDKDLIQFWGECKGSETYKTVLGASMTIPSINAQIINVVGQD